jgi:CDGSH-type Zn-finger protein/uncharacterized Fe-S cluster protein YjdI
MRVCNFTLESAMAEEIVVGKIVTVHFNAQKCIHSRNCVLDHPEVFVPNKDGEWIYPDAASAEKVITIGLRCPSGAISVRLNDGSATSDDLPVVNTLRVRENGPLAIEADLVVNGVSQNTVRATLCRCGASLNKPFCDGAHHNAGFIATGEPQSKDAEPLEVRNGPVNVQAIPNASLKIEGNLELVSGTGRTINKVTSAYLCRCGASQNKPYCDGSHKAAGFLAP